MKRVSVLLLWLFAWQSMLAAADAPMASRPNIVFIMADDLGWRQAVRIKTGSLHYPGWGVWRIQGLCFGRVMDRVVSSSAGMRRHHGWFCFEVIV